MNVQRCKLIVLLFALAVGAALLRAVAEFEFTLVFADAPIDKFARG